jgi:3-oxoacyl-[acyl-carrier protein] reductase
MNKTALITGISGGIGTALLEKFVKNDCFVIGQFCSARDKIETLKKRFGKDTAEFVQCDFSDADKTERFARDIALRYPEIDCLVNNAGIDRQELFTDSDNVKTREILDVNLFAPMIVTREIVKKMISNKRGSIVNITSVWGVCGGSCEAVYSASKGGLIAFTKALAREEGLSNVRVNCVSGGFIDTPMTACFSDETKNAFCENVALGRTGSPEEVADAVYYLCSDEASYVTGQVLGADGGF